MLSLVTVNLYERTGTWKQILGKRQAATSRKRASSGEVDAIVPSERVYASWDDESARVDDRVREARDFGDEDERNEAPASAAWAEL